MFILHTAAPCMFPAAAPLSLLPCCCGAARLGLCGTTPLITYVSTEQRWNDIKREKYKSLKKNVSQSHFVNQKFHMACPQIEANRRGEEPLTNSLSHGTARYIASICPFSISRLVPTFIVLL